MYLPFCVCLYGGQRIAFGRVSSRLPCGHQAQVVRRGGKCPFLSAISLVPDPRLWVILLPQVSECQDAGCRMLHPCEVQVAFSRVEDGVPQVRHRATQGWLQFWVVGSPGPPEPLCPPAGVPVTGPHHQRSPTGHCHRAVFRRVGAGQRPGGHTMLLPSEHLLQKGVWALPPGACCLRVVTAS